MNIQQHNGIVSTITLAPYLDIEEYQTLRNDLFREALLTGDASPKNRIDVYDESILTFETYPQALTYLINVFRAAVKLGESSNINFSLRSSLCEGDYFIQQDQIYGDAVNFATKLSCTSRENELLVCGIDQRIIKAFIDSQHDLRYSVRNQVDNCISIWLQDEHETDSRDNNKEFRVECNSKARVFETSRNQKILVGRSRDSDIVIDSEEISRNHATISLNYDHIFIEDHSSNGTYLYFNRREVYLTNDRVKLSNKGYISCGRDLSDKNNRTGVISYRLCKQSSAVA